MFLEIYKDCALLKKSQGEKSILIQFDEVKRLLKCMELYNCLLRVQFAYKVSNRVFTRRDCKDLANCTRILLANTLQEILLIMILNKD